MLKLEQPQEIEVWYLLPAIRRELALTLINKYSLTQKQTANIIGVTEAAISQYIKSKRAGAVKFGKNYLDKIDRAANRLIKDKSLLMAELKNICDDYRKDKSLCELHKKYGTVNLVDCDICLK